MPSYTDFYAIPIYFKTSHDFKMAGEDAAVQQFIIYKCGSVLTLIGVMWLFRGTIKYYTQQKVFAYVMHKITNRMNKATARSKKKLFSEVHNYKERVSHDLKILEVGAGTAANLAFLPSNCKLTCLDPNPHFEGYIKENLGKSDTVVTAEIIQGVAENIPLENDTFDVVMCTMVLCCVPSAEQSLSEIRRVLKPVSMLIFTVFV